MVFKYVCEKCGKVNHIITNVSSIEINFKIFCDHCKNESGCVNMCHMHSVKYYHLNSSTGRYIPKCCRDQIVDYDLYNTVSTLRLLFIECKEIVQYMNKHKIGVCVIVCPFHSGIQYNNSGRNMFECCERELYAINQISFANSEKLVHDINNTICKFEKILDCNRKIARMEFNIYLLNLEKQSHMN